MFFNSATCALSLITSAHASLFITSPVASTTCVGGKPCVIDWTNDKTAPPDLSAYGPVMVGLWTGSVTQQTELMKFGNVDPTAENSMSIVIPPKTGPNGNTYFIRMDQVKPTNNGAPYQAFSARFTLSGMTGTASPVSPVPPGPDGAKPGVLGGPIANGSASTALVMPASPTGAPTVARTGGYPGSSNSSAQVGSVAPFAALSSTPATPTQSPPASMTSGAYSRYLATMFNSNPSFSLIVWISVVLCLIDTL